MLTVAQKRPVMRGRGHYAVDQSGGHTGQQDHQRTYDSLLEAGGAREFWLARVPSAEYGLRRISRASIAAGAIS